MFTIEKPASEFFDFLGVKTLHVALLELPRARAQQILKSHISLFRQREKSSAQMFKDLGIAHVALAVDTFSRFLLGQQLFSSPVHALLGVWLNLAGGR